MAVYYFDNADHAMKWATEIMRKNSFPKLSGIYREMTNDDNEDSVKWFANYGQLPSEWEDKQALAMKVYKLFDYLSPDQKAILKLRYWGDYSDERRLATAKSAQEYYRMHENKRVRLSYRYSYRQIGTILGMDHKTAKRRIDMSLKEMERWLNEYDLLEGFEMQQAV